MAAKKIRVDFYYDVISPYSYLAFEVLHRYKKLWTTMDLRLRPFSIKTVIIESKNVPLSKIPPKATYAGKDLRRLSTFCKVPLRIPSNYGAIAREKGSGNALRFLVAIAQLTNEEKTEHISRTFLKRVFANEPGLDIFEVDSLRAAGQDAGLSEELIQSAIGKLNSAEVKDIVENNTRTALEHGAFGAPTIVVHQDSGPEMLFGSDRIELLAFLLGEKYLGPLAEQ